MDNGIEYSEAHTAVTINAFPYEKNLHIEVSNQGHGIAEEHLGRIF
ncbi:MAG: ATP-binding protein [Deltaproteobacteria bacterium]|nr:ATP-binding protein [Deltaproteobacteria bacterium]